MISIRSSITALIVLVLLSTLVALSFVTISISERVILPEIRAKASLVARSSAGLISRAIEAGIPLDELVGVRSSFAETLAANSDLIGMRLVREDGRVLVDEWSNQPDGSQTSSRSSDLFVPVSYRGETLARVEVFVDPQVVESRIRSIWIDQAIIIFVSLFITLELMAATFSHGAGAGILGAELRISRLNRGLLEVARPEERQGLLGRLAQPIDRLTDRLATEARSISDLARDAGKMRVVRIAQELHRRYGIGRPVITPVNGAEKVRPALFMFMLSEELTRSFVPHTSKQLGQAVANFPSEIVTGLPIAVFMLVVALSQPIFGPLVDRLNRQGTFIAGALVGAAGHIGAAMAGDWYVFLAFRALTALGYALVFIAAQITIAEAASDGSRSRGFGVFIRAITVAGLCGPPIGGIIVDRLGFQAGFWVAAIIAASSLLLGYGAFPPSVKQAEPSTQAATEADLRNVVSDPLLNALVFFCALPAKLMLVGFCFYLVPVRMEQDGFSMSAIGRLQMLYPVVMVLSLPVFAYWADRAGRRAPFVIVGGVIAGLAALYPMFETAPLTLAAALIQLSFGQAISIASQSALVTEYARHMHARQGTVLGVFRLVERTGNALGPIAAAAVLATLGFEAAALAMGGAVVAGVSLFFVVERKRKNTQPVDAEAVA